MHTCTCHNRQPVLAALEVHALYCHANYGTGHIPGTLGWRADEYITCMLRHTLETPMQAWKTNVGALKEAEVDL